MTTFEDILKACGKGIMPWVTTSIPLKNAKSNIGNRGIAVHYSGLPYDIWYWGKPLKTGRFIHELTIEP